MNTSLLFLVVSLLWPSYSFGNRCGLSKCSGTSSEPRSLCIIADEPQGNILEWTMWQAAMAGACGYQSDRHIVKSAAGVQKLMDRLKKNCTTIKEINFHGHSVEGLQDMTSLNMEDLGMWKNYACMMVDGVDIKVQGCHFGKGCQGALAVHKMATTMLSSARGTVTAPMSYATTYAGITPYFSLDGRHRELKYNPKASPKETWNIKGLSLSDGGSVPENCNDEVQKLVQKVRNAKQWADRQGCYVDSFYFGEEKLVGMELYVSKLKKGQKYNYKKIYDMVKFLGYQEFNLRDCRPEAVEIDSRKSSM